jgi:hemerythrin-like domain-containing protein
MRQHREIGAAIATFIEILQRGSLRTSQVAAMLEVLRRHIYVEEVFLFPAIREAGIVIPIVAMMREHGQLWATMESLTQLLTEPEDSPRLKAACTQLLDQLHKHSFNEEPAIYLHANYEFSSSTSAELTRFVATGRLPEGWTCQQAKT